MGWLLRIALAALLVSTHSSQAQEPSGSINLGGPAMQRQPLLAVASVMFEKSVAVCPDHEALVYLSDGALRYFNPMTFSKANRRASFTPVTDDAFAHRVASADCRTTITVRQQVRRENASWTALLVLPSQRPSLSREERDKALLEYEEHLRKQLEALPPEKRRGDGKRYSTTIGPVGWSSFGFVFENAPPVCVDGLANLSFDRDGVTFSLLSKLPAGLNRFVIEREDVDDTQARLYFVQDNCRYEFTITSSVFYRDQWIARPFVLQFPSKPAISPERRPDAPPR